MNNIISSVNEVNANEANILLCETINTNSFLEVKSLIELSINRGLDKSFICLNDNKAALLASKYGDIATLKHLIELGADIYNRDNFCIRYAAMHNNPRTVKFLFEQGADFSANNYHTLKQVRRHGHTDLVALFVSNAHKLPEERLEYLDYFFLPHEIEIINNNRNKTINTKTTKTFFKKLFNF